MPSADVASRSAAPTALEVASHYSCGPHGHVSRVTRSSHWTERSTVARSPSTDSGNQSRGTSARTLYINPFGFDSKTSYDASEKLLNFRSETYEARPPEEDGDIWKRPPPDFRPQCYAPKPPTRNSREAMKPWKYGTFPGHREVYKRPKKVLLPSILQAKQGETKRFVSSGFDILDSDDARLLYASEGMYKAGEYENPQPHDFRGYPSLKSLALDEFETKYEHDPYNIKFKSERLDIIRGLAFGPATDRDTSGTQMAPPLPEQLQWEARLILPKSPWPKLSGEFTRHRLAGRSPKSALMARIEERLSSEWAKEKLKSSINVSHSAPPKSTS